jgi:hypothetical protein
MADAVFDSRGFYVDAGRIFEKLLCEGRGHGVLRISGSFDEIQLRSFAPERNDITPRALVSRIKKNLK